MSSAHVEAIAMAAMAAFWLVISVLAFRTQRRTGYKSQWRWVALFGVAVGLIVIILNLNGIVIAGGGGETTHGLSGQSVHG